MTRSKSPTPGLLISVRSVAEAAAALEGGADIIDIKEPLRGSLGRAENETIAAIVKFVAQRRVVSAAMGELPNQTPDPPPGLDFIKWGLAGCKIQMDWRKTLASLLTSQGSPQTVITAYADHEEANSPPLEEVISFACQWPSSIFLLDTFEKKPTHRGNRFSLVDWLSISEITHLCHRLHQAGLQVALAGSLTREHIISLKEARPDWFAVRGAVCERGQRRATVQSKLVRELTKILHGSPIIPCAN